MKLNFDNVIKVGVEQIMENCQLAIGMTLKAAVEMQIPEKPKKILMEISLVNVVLLFRTEKEENVYIIAPIADRLWIGVRRNDNRKSNRFAES